MTVTEIGIGKYLGQFSVFAAVDVGFRVLHEHIATLSKTLRPEHKDLLIPSVYLRESPWLPAQEALRALDAARAPRDKIRCVSRCAKCLVDLLGLSGSCAAADDFTPVLVYVIIKVCG